MPFYYLGSQQLLDPRYQVTIDGYVNSARPAFTVIGNMQSEFGFGGGNNFDSRADAITNAANAIGGKVGSAIGAVKGFRDGVDAISQAGRGASRFITQFETEAVWQGSRKPTFQIDLTFVCLDSEDPKEDVVDRATTLFRFVFPDVDGGRLTPPLGYNTSTSNSGKIALTIGDWFYADKLVATDCNFSFSKELNRYGKPIFATGSITLEPFRTISYKEMRKYFRF